ncbi:MAG TPA: glycosyltransferase [Alphaproteobacteria bacterium]|nr:glycosyltransferase [Alphaproteobacteria bacterium]
MSADGRLMLQVCLCTHNPRPETFHKVLTALRHQTQRTCFELVLVDNASNPPIEEWMCRNALGDEIQLRIEREHTLGIAAARVRAAETTTADWILFVDDDTELSPDYIEQGLRIIADNPTIGCFGGKLVLPDYLSPARWMRPLLPFLAIKDLGNEAVTSVADEWRHCEPPTAGAFVRRSVLNRYLAMMRANQLAPSLGRRGHNGLRSGEDSLMMRGAYALGLSVSYQPALKLVHHLHPNRLRFGYLLRLMWGHGRTLFILDRIAAATGGRTSALSHRSAMSALRMLFRSTASEVQKSLRYACCMLAFRLAYRWELIVPDVSLAGIGMVAEDADQKSKG